MPKIVPIVEGYGEPTAVPVLLRKLLDEMGRYDIQIATPKNAHGRGNMTGRGGLERFVRYSWSERECGAVLVLVDVDEGCALDTPKDFAARIKMIGVRYPVVVVAANRMYENWLVASLETIRGKDLEGRVGLSADAEVPPDAEAVNGKGYINEFLPDGRAYKETLDQEAMTRLLDTTLAATNSRSFRRLRHAITEAVQAIDAGERIVTPRFAAAAVPPVVPEPPQARNKKR